jgi:aminoglycoside phosphotransferase (APT) family kinase protein
MFLNTINQDYLNTMERLYTIEQIKPFVKQFTNADKIEFIGCGDDSEAFCVNNEFVFKFPKHDDANISIKNEITLLKSIQKYFEIEIPNVIYESVFEINKKKYTFFVSKKMNGINLSKEEFLSLGFEKLENAAKTIAKFLKSLHKLNKDNSEKDSVLLHGDFSLNHILFENGNVSGILDFADNHIGNYYEDFKYLLDNEDPEEFGITFGEKVLSYYMKYN